MTRQSRRNYRTQTNVYAALEKLDDRVMLSGISYQLGTGSPPMNVDPGGNAGQYASDTPTTLQAHLWPNLMDLVANPDSQDLANTVLAILGKDPFSFGPDATAHLTHFLNNTGSTISADVARLVNESEDAHDAYEASFNAAVAYVNALCFGGQIDIHQNVASFTTITDDTNWQEALGRFTNWGSAHAQAFTDSANNRIISMQFTFHLYDPYDWDPSVDIFQDKLAGLHRAGLAKEFLVTGEFTVNAVWYQYGGQPPAVPNPPEEPDETEVAEVENEEEITVETENPPVATEFSIVEDEISEVSGEPVALVDEEMTSEEPMLLDTVFATFLDGPDALEPETF